MKLKGSITLEASITTTLVLCLILFMMVQAYYIMSVTVIRQTVRREGIDYVIGNPLQSEEEWLQKIPFLTSVSVNYRREGTSFIVKVKTEWIPFEIPFFSLVGLKGNLETEVQYKNIVDMNELRVRRFFSE